MQNDETAARAAAPPVVDAAADWVCALLAEKAEATETGDKNGWLYKWEVESISGVIRSLRARAGRAEAERDEARQVVRDTLWMAGRYADGRRTYAVSMYNDARRIAEAGGFASKEDPTRTEPAIDGDAPEWPTLAERLRQAEAERDEARRLLAEAASVLRAARVEALAEAERIAYQHRWREDPENADAYELGGDNAARSIGASITALIAAAESTLPTPRSASSSTAGS